MSHEISKLINSLRRETTALSSQPKAKEKERLDIITQHLQELCRQLVFYQTEFLKIGSSDTEEHTHQTLQKEIGPSLTKLEQNQEITDLFQIAVYLSDPEISFSTELLQVLSRYHGSHFQRLCTPAIRPMRSNILDKEQIKLWLQAQPEKQIELRASLEAIKHISQEEFETAFQASVASFNRQMQKDSKNLLNPPSYIAVSWHFKSQAWMLKLALPQLDILPEEILDFENIEEEVAILSQKLKKFKACKIVIFDDAIYSGKQMRGILGKFINLYFDLGFSYPSFQIVCPFITEKGKKFLQEEYAQLIGLSLQFAEHRTMPTFQTKIAELPDGAKIFQRLLKTRLRGNLYAKRLGTYWFDHKVPDQISFPSFISQGLVFDKAGNAIAEDGRLVQYKLIPKTLPPYKLF